MVEGPSQAPAEARGWKFWKKPEAKKPAQEESLESKKTLTGEEFQQLLQRRAEIVAKKQANSEKYEPVRNDASEQAKQIRRTLNSEWKALEEREEQVESSPAIVEYERLANAAKEIQTKIVDLEAEWASSAPNKPIFKFEGKVNPTEPEVLPRPADDASSDEWEHYWESYEQKGDYDNAKRLFEDDLLQFNADKAAYEKNYQELYKLKNELKTFVAAQELLTKEGYSEETKAKEQALEEYARNNVEQMKGRIAKGLVETPDTSAEQPTTSSAGGPISPAAQAKVIAWINSLQ